MKREDDIMADDLLKGGKMLSKTCPSCGCPLFEYKGETFCGVCREEAAGAKGEQLPPVIRDIPATERSSQGETTDLACSLEETLIALSIRIRQEPDPERAMMKRALDCLLRYTQYWFEEIVAKAEPVTDPAYREQVNARKAKIRDIYRRKDPGGAVATATLGW